MKINNRIKNASSIINGIISLLFLISFGLFANPAFAKQNLGGFVQTNFSNQQFLTIEQIFNKTIEQYKNFTKPQIISAFVKPDKVVPGDTMTITVEVEDNFGIKSVTADMGGIEIVELKQIEGNIYQGVWENKWNVHDTEQKEYITIITITNILNKTATKEIKWSDPVRLLTGAAESSWTTSDAPYNTSYYDSRAQSIYLKADLNDAGITGSTVISEVCLYCSALPGQSIPGLRIRMQNTSLTSLSDFTTTGWTTVYGPTGYGRPAAGTWKCHTLNPTFTWDGTSNLMIDVYRNDSAGVAGGGNYVRATGAGRTYAGYCDNCSGCGVGGDCDSPTTKAAFSHVLSLKLTYGCATSTDPGISTVYKNTNYNIYGVSKTGTLQRACYGTGAVELGTTGNFCGDDQGTAAAGDICNSTKAWVDGSLITGNRAACCGPSGPDSNSRLPDTGQVSCWKMEYDEVNGFDCTCGDPPAGQDAEYTCSNSGTCGPSYTDNGNETITDNCTKLMWQKCSKGLSGSGCTTGTFTEEYWDDALSYCEGLNFAGHTDWRLPNIKELMSIVDYGRAWWAIDATYFPNFVGDTGESFFSSTSWQPYPDGDEASAAWGVDFAYGHVTDRWKDITYGVHCVRG